MTLPSSGHLQTISIPKKDALKVLAAADSAKVHKQHIALLLKDTALYGARIRELRSAILVLDKTVDSYKRDSAHYEQIITLITQQKDLAISEANAWERAYKKERRKRFWTGVAGSVMTAAAFLIKSR